MYKSEHLRKLHLSNLGKKRTPEQCKRISDSLKGRVSPMKGKKMSAEHKSNIGKANSNPSPETRLKKSLGAKRRVIDGSHNFWRGGKTEHSKILRHSFEYRLWRKSVFERDNFTCVWCGARSRKGKPVEIQADHVKPFCDFPALRFAIDNGRTLCRDCHKKTDTFGWNNFNNKKI